MAVTRKVAEPRFFIGSGKVDEIKARIAESGADLVVVDAALSPGQERNLEKALECRVLDRSGLILDIFAQRARTFEGKLQVELAQLEHMATRLVRGWTHLERQKGGIGLRGPGETQLETDRRLLARRIKTAERSPRQGAGRSAKRRARSESAAPCPPWRSSATPTPASPRCSIASPAADAYAADQLFATLDPTVRRLDLAPGPRWRSPTRSASCATCRTSWWRRSARRCRKRARRPAAARDRRGDPERDRAHRAGQRGARVDRRRSRCRRSPCSTRSTARARRRAWSRGADGRLDRVWLSAHSGQGVDLLLRRAAGAARRGPASLPCCACRPPRAGRGRGCSPPARCCASARSRTAASSSR